jgi:hypothetical protein
VSLIDRLRAFLRGEDQIAIELELQGEEVIHEDEWRKLPEKERAKWEATDNPMSLYRRKPW